MTKKEEEEEEEEEEVDDIHKLIKIFSPNFFISKYIFNLFQHTFNNLRMFTKKINCPRHH